MQWQMLHLQQGLCQAGERPQALQVPKAHALPLNKTYMQLVVGKKAKQPMVLPKKRLNEPPCSLEMKYFSMLLHENIIYRLAAQWAALPAEDQESITPISMDLCMHLNL